MADHYCEFAVQGPNDDEDSRWVYCGKPAPLKMSVCWYCAEHFDLIERAMAIVKGVISART